VLVRLKPISPAPYINFFFMDNLSVIKSIL
jgi:hypothetical protein